MKKFEIPGHKPSYLPDGEDFTLVWNDEFDGDTAILELSERISMKTDVQRESIRQKCLITHCRICAPFFARIMRLPIFPRIVL